MPEADWFHYTIDKRNKKITLVPVDSKESGNGHCVSIYSSNGRSKVKLFNMAKIFRQFGVAWEENFHKIYKVKRRGQTLEVQL